MTIHVRTADPNMYLFYDLLPFLDVDKKLMSTFIGSLVQLATTDDELSGKSPNRPLILSL